MFQQPTNPSPQSAPMAGQGAGQQFAAPSQQPFAQPAMPGQGFNQPVAGPSPTNPSTFPAPGFSQPQSTPQPTAQPFQFGDGSSWGAAGQQQPQFPQQQQFPQSPQQPQQQQPQWAPVNDPNILGPIQGQPQQNPFSQPLVQPAPAQQWSSNSQQPSPPQQAPVDPRLQQQLAQYGVDPNLPPEQQMAALNQRMQAMYAAYSTMGQQQQQQQQEPPQQQQAADEFDPDKYFGEAWKQPAWSPQFDAAINGGMVVRDENGLFRPAPGYEMMVMGIIGPLNEAMQAQTQNVQQLFRDNPYRKFYEVAREPIRREILREAQELVRQELSVVRDREVVQEFEKQNASWLYASDQYGRKVTTPAGEAFLREAESLVQMGMPMQRAIEVAQRMLPPQLQSQFQAPQQQFAMPQQQPFPPLVQPAGQANVLPPLGQQPPAMQAPLVQPQMGMPQVQQPYPQQFPNMGQQAQYPNPPMLGAPTYAPAQASAMQQQSFIDSALQRSSYQPYANGAWAATAPQGQASPSTDGLETMFTDAARRMAA